MNEISTFDVIIIGAGICGCAVAYELSRYDARVLVIDKENDVSMGTTKANSGIVHGGYDPQNGTLMAKYNVLGNKMIKELASRLDVTYKQTGALVIALDENELPILDELYHRGIKNGVEQLSLLSAGQTMALEPNLSTAVVGALYSPTAAVVSPWELCLALAQCASGGGVQFKLSTNVVDIKKDLDTFTVYTNNGDFKSAFVINAAGVSSDKIASTVSAKNDCGFKIKPNKGEYYLLDHSQADIVSHIIFQCPSKSGKGVLVAPTAHNNIIVGPTAVDCEYDDASTTTDGLSTVRCAALKSVPSINFRENIRNFAGIRANSNQDDFIINEAIDGFINIAGIKSPGLSSAPAIAVDVVDMLKKRGISSTLNPHFVHRRTVVRFNSLSEREKTALIKEKPAFGRVICRCETITEGEILAALHSSPAPQSIDGIKRRCGSGMGRCQGGFCSGRVHEILSRELGIPMENILLDGDGTFILTGKTKEVGLI